MYTLSSTIYAPRKRPWVQKLLSRSVTKKLPISYTQKCKRTLTTKKFKKARARRSILRCYSSLKQSLRTKHCGEVRPPKSSAAQPSTVKRRKGCRKGVQLKKKKIQHRNLRVRTLTHSNRRRLGHSARTSQVTLLRLYPGARKLLRSLRRVLYVVTEPRHKLSRPKPLPTISRTFTHTMFPTYESVLYQKTAPLVGEIPSVYARDIYPSRE